MDLDERHRHRGERVADRETRVAVRARVHQRTRRRSAHAMDRVDQVAFPVVLGEIDVDRELATDARQSPLDVRQRRRPVDRRFSRAEEIQAGAVENRDSHFFLSPDSQLLNCSVSTPALSSVLLLSAPPSIGAALSAFVSLPKNWSNENALDSRRVGLPSPDGLSRKTVSRESSFFAGRTARSCVGVGASGWAPPNAPASVDAAASSVGATVEPLNNPFTDASV